MKTRPPRGPVPARTRTGRRGRGTILALVAVLACLAAVVLVELNRFPAGAAAPDAGTGKRIAGVSWPAGGTSAADVNGSGVTDGPGATRQVPIASVAKLMTAYAILRDHPLSPGESGPLITVRASEAAGYSEEASDGDSLVPVSAGEEINERQALEALLLPSADNMAWILARWDAGSQDAFVAKMNAAARSLGMTSTTYTDASGLDSSTVSTAADQVRLGEAAMKVPVLAAIAGLPAAYVPVAGEIRNTNTLLGEAGIVGLKTGSTQAAGGCVLIAARKEVSGHSALIVAAVFGQPGTSATILPNALRAGRDLVLSLGAALGPGARPRPVDPVAASGGLDRRGVTPATLRPVLPRARGSRVQRRL